MFLIVGLGNYGEQYSNNRHNVGFLFLDYIKKKYNLNDFKKKNNFLYSLNNYFNNDIVLLKPLTYVNLTGNAITSAMAFFKIHIKNIIVIYDDIALPFSKIRIRDKGSDGGHNGLKNIQLQLGTTEYKRIRIGIGTPDFFCEMKNFVLSDFSANELNLLFEKVFPVVDSALQLIITKNIREAMNKFNGFDITKS